MFKNLFRKEEGTRGSTPRIAPPKTEGDGKPPGAAPIKIVESAPEKRS